MSIINYGIYGRGPFPYNWGGAFNNLTQGGAKMYEGIRHLKNRPTEIKVEGKKDKENLEKTKPKDGSLTGPAGSLQKNGETPGESK